jgi:hypothetical protein
MFNYMGCSEDMVEEGVKKYHNLLTKVWTGCWSQKHD